MTRRLAASFAMAALSTALLRAQAPAKPASAVIEPVKTQTVTGCLKTSAATPGRYELTDATEATIVDGKAESKPKGTTGSAAAKKTYGVVGIVPPGVDLSKHVSHKVELSGAVVDPALVGDALKFDMHSLKMIAATCP